MPQRAPKILIAFLVAAATALTQNSAEPSGPTAAVPQVSPAAGADTHDASSLVLAAKPNDVLPQVPADSDGVTRTVSPGVAADLALGMPKYNPPKPTPAPSAQSVDLRDIDKPKNEIKRLPTYVVREKRPPVFKDKDLFTAEGLANLSFKSHPGLLFGNFLGLNSATAYQMYLDDQRQEEMTDLSDTAHAMALGGDLTEGKYILQQSQDTYMRRSDDFGPTGSGGGISGRPQ